MYLWVEEELPEIAAAHGRWLESARGPREHSAEVDQAYVGHLGQEVTQDLGMPVNTSQSLAG